MLRLYVKCPYCNSIFPSGFQADSPIQLIGMSYLCKKCLLIFPCPAPNYLEKVEDGFKKAMKKEEVFSLPPEKMILLDGKDLFELDKEIILPSGTRIASNKPFVVFRGETDE